MAFDLASAKPTTTSEFDLSTAVPVNPTAQQPPEHSLIDGALATLNRIGTGAYGMDETAAHLGTGAIAGLGGGLGFLSQLATNGGNVDDAKNFQEKVQNDFTYQPRTDAGKTLAHAIDTAVGVIPKGLNRAGEFTTDVTGSPLLGAAVNTGGNALLQLAGLRGMRGVGRASEAAVEGAAPALLPRARITSPEVTPRAPPTTPNELLQRSLDTGKDVGYQTTPNFDPQATFLERLGQGISGKAQLEQGARVQNQGVTNALGARAVGQAPGSVVTQELLRQIRKTAADKGYDPISKLEGDIPADVQFLKNNAAIKSAHGNGLSGSPDVVATADLLNQSSFDPAEITDQISTLRSRAGDAFSTGRSDAGTAFRKQAEELEALLDRHLQDLDGAPPGLLKNYRAARQLIAKTHNVGDNLNPSTGNIDASGLAKLLADGAPLSGDLKTIADFANAAPSITRVPQGSPLPTSPFNTLAGAAAAHGTGGLSLALIPAARAFASKWLLKRNENPALLQPLDKPFGQSVLDAVHGNAAAFRKLYGNIAPGSILSTDQQAQ